MNYYTFVALQVWAIDRDLLSFPVRKALELFRKDAVSMKRVYSYPEDVLLFIQGVEDVDPIEFFTDYILCYARMSVESGECSYGIYDKEIINYNRNN